MSGLSQNALEELSSERDYEDRIPHFCYMIRFACLKNGNTLEAIGGLWEIVDGNDPSVDKFTLVHTALRYAKDLTGLDLKNCQHWNPFLEVHDDRVGKDAVFSHKEMHGGINGLHTRKLFLRESINMLLKKSVVLFPPFLRWRELYRRIVLLNCINLDTEIVSGTPESCSNNRLQQVLLFSLFKEPMIHIVLGAVVGDLIIEEDASRFTFVPLILNLGSSESFANMWNSKFTFVCLRCFIIDRL